MTSHHTASATERVEDSMPALSVMILYEDMLTGWRAKRMLDRVLGEISAPEPADVGICHISLLKEPMPRARATRMAADSEIVVLSVYGRRAALRELNAWLEAWEPNGTGAPKAFALLLHEDSVSRENPNLWLSRLRELARRKGFDFFFALCGAAPPNPPPAMRQAAQCALEGVFRQPAYSSKLRTAAAEPYRHWGINE